MAATAQYYLDVLEEAEFDAESLTVLVVSGATREQVAVALSIDLGRPAGLGEFVQVDGVDLTAWVLVDVAGGVLAIERTGYGDPSPRVLAEVSAPGRSAAVARSNIQAHERFGCARDGVLAFDEDEYMFTEDPETCPPELRPLFDTVWDGLEGDAGDDFSYSEVAGVITGLAMVEQWTGIQLTVQDFVNAQEAQGFLARSLVYLE